MRFTKEFKLDCVQKYKNGEPINDPGGCKHKTFVDTLRRWARIYDSVGEVGLEYKKPKRAWQDKMNMIQRVLNGESISEVAYSNGIQEDLLSKWYKIYQESDIDGLKLDRRGRPPKMAKKPKAPNEPKTKEELEEAMIKYINYYNNERIMEKTKGLSQLAYRQQSFVQLGY